MSTFDEKQLGQLRPLDTLAASLYTPPSGKTGVITTIHVCNVTSSSASFSIFLDDNGTTYTTDTAIYYNIPLDPYSTAQIQTHVGMPTYGGNLAVSSTIAGALTFTAHGLEVY